MSKARDTANFVSTGVPNSLITLDAAEIPNISTDKLTSGTLANARVADLPTSKITSGTFADARISASSVTAHVTATDLTPVRQDILTLGLKQAVQENSTKFNLTNSAITKFEADADFNLAGSTTVARNSGEYVSSAVLGSLVANTNTATAIGGGNIVQDSSAVTNSQDGLATTQTSYTTGSSTSGFQTFDWGSSKLIHTLDLGKKKANGDGTSITLMYSTDDSTYTPVNLVNTTQTTVNYNGSQPALSNFTSSGTADWAVHSGNQDSVILKLTGFTQFTARYLKYTFNSGSWGDANAGYTQTKTYSQGYDVNATGTALGTTNVPTSAVTDVSGVMLLKNATGTNTLGTDIKVYFTANNSAWTEATSYTDAGTFSTGIKMIKLGKTTCTSGSDVRWKAVWANQSASKEAQIYGIGLNY